MSPIPIGYGTAGYGGGPGVAGPGQYGYATLGQAQQELANRLYDSTMQFWPATELVANIQESFRTWNALTSYWRGDFTFPTAQNTLFYDINDPVAMPNTLRPYSITDQSLYQSIAASLLEPPFTDSYPLGWAFVSAQFTIDDVMEAVQRRMDEVLGISGCTMVRRMLAATNARVFLPNTVIDVRRVAYTPASGFGSTSIVWQDDIWALQSYKNNWTTQPDGTPSVYSISTEPVLAIDLDRRPNVPAQIDTLTIESGPTLSLAASTVIPIPTDWAWVIRWGALADLLGRESNAKDLLRAKYCEGRYRQGISLLSSASALLGLRAANLPIPIESMQSADQYNTGWQGATPGSPQMALVAGLNLFALSPPPPNTSVSCTATVVKNAPVPVQVIDYLQISHDLYDVILDYAQHLCAFKMGGAEFVATMPLLDRFMQLAATYNSSLSMQGQFEKTIYSISQREDDFNPRYAPNADPAGGVNG